MERQEDKDTHVHDGLDALHVTQVFELRPLIGFKRHGGGVGVEGSGRGAFGGPGSGGELRLEGGLVVGQRHRGAGRRLVRRAVVHPLVTSAANNPITITCDVCGKQNPITITCDVCGKQNPMTIRIYFIHPSGNIKLSSDRTTKNISQ